MRVGLICVALGAILTTTAAAGDADRVTFTKDVLPIIQENCQGCHRPLGANMAGMIAPMALMDYNDVRPWAKAIAKAVASREMPPWHASDHTRGVFKNERTLTPEEIAILVAWAEQGAVRGNPEDAPAPREFPKTAWQLSGKFGDPDLVLKMPEPFFVADDVEDIQPLITIPIGKDILPEMKWVRAIEYRPGSEVVHHIVGFTLKPGEGGSDEDLRNRSNFGQIASGTDPQNYEEGYGLPLYPGTTLALSMHYHKEPGPGTGVYDQSEVAVWFHDAEVKHPLESSTISYGDFEIPPYHANWRVGGARTWKHDFIVLELLPHMHLRGAAAKYTAYYPDGTSEVLLEVPRYEYEWQTSYEYKEYKHMPAGTRIEYEIIYDNSEAMAQARRFDSSQAVRFGGPTTDEMDLGWLTWCYAEEGKWPDGFQDQADDATD